MDNVENDYCSKEKKTGYCLQCCISVTKYKLAITV